MTPFRDDERIDCFAWQTIVDAQISSGVHGLFAGGSTGEFYAQDLEERTMGLRFVRQAAAGRVPVYANVGCITTRDTIKLAQAAQAEGVDVLAIVTPYYLKPSQAELADHYIEVCRAVRLPVLAYNFPLHGGVEILPETVAQIASQCANLVGVKDSSGSMERLTGYRDAVTDREFAIFIGPENLILAGLQQGCAGVVSGSANFAPQLFVDLYRACRDGNQDERGAPAGVGGSRDRLHLTSHVPQCDQRGGGHCRRLPQTGGATAARGAQPVTGCAGGAPKRRLFFNRAPQRQRVVKNTMHTNRLANEKSPYLLQHAHNPVDWYAWGPEAFEKARAENKPIFLSIGYSTCHWCHVMERESFENESIAELLNRDYVAIKVDREERPDVDRIYMTFVQATTGSGGWPMSVWLTPELQPFFGGTYFPPENRLGHPGFASILTQIADAWQNDRRADSRHRRATWWSSSQKQVAVEPAHAAARPSIPPCSTAASPCSAAPSTRHLGGFGGAPKFPRPSVYNFLLRYHARTKNQEALDMVLLTLREMAKGGMNDQLGGGFHRYSVDERWFVPHFEKMLYDQAQLAISYLEAFQITGDAQYADTARRIFDYVLRDMTDAEGGFYSAEDADSVIDPEEPHDKGEGAFYIWSAEEIRELVPTPLPRLVLLSLRRGRKRQCGQRSARRIHRQEHPLSGGHAWKRPREQFEQPVDEDPRGHRRSRAASC